MYIFLPFRLLEQVPEAMKSHALTWGRLVYPLLAHGTTILREQAIHVMNSGMEFLLAKQETIGPGLESDLKVSS